MIRSTIQLYSAVVTDTASAILRGPFVWLMLIGLPIVLGLLSMVLAPLGIIGGFALGFASVYFYGAYLYAVGQSIERKNPLGIGIIRESLGHHLWDVMHIAFLHWICSLVFSLGGLPAAVPTLLGIVAFVLFNPWPEVIHSERTNGAMDILVRAFRFMTQNGPEWVIPHLLLVGLGWAALNAPASALSSVGLGLGVFLHPVMVFRGALYRRLAGGSRRARTWRSQF